MDLMTISKCRTSFCCDCGELIKWECTRCKSCDKKGRRNKKWKEETGYIATHTYIRRNKPTDNKCEKCKKEKELEAANISGKYTKKIEDYKWLCKSCHSKLDNPSGLIGKNMWRGKLSE